MKNMLVLLVVASSTFFSASLVSAAKVSKAEALKNAMTEVGVSGQVVGHSVEYVIENVQCSFNPSGSRCQITIDVEADVDATTTAKEKMNLAGVGANDLVKALKDLGARVSRLRNGSAMNLAKVTCHEPTDDMPEAPVECEIVDTVQ